jgi:hypothetical protein
MANLKNLDIQKIQKAFSPAMEIQDPHLFVGRKQEVQSGMTALLNPGGFLAIFGLRGVGKTSIAYQIKLIAEGNRVLPGIFHLEQLIPRRGFNFIVHYVRCDGFIKNIGDLLRRLMFGDEANPSLFSITKLGDRRLKEFSRTMESQGGFNFFGAKIGTSGKEESKYESYISGDISQQFRQLVGTIRKDNQNKTGLLIIIDEFDTIPDKEGFASLVKTCSSDYVKFGIVGIAGSITELVNDHTSIGRQIDMIRVPPMPEDELQHILRRAEYAVDETITFDEPAAHAIATGSEGFPYFSHLLGRETMIMAFMQQSTKVTSAIVEALHQNISQGRLNTIYEDVYQNAVKHSAQREVLLKIFAEQKEDDIHTEEVYSLARDLGITNPSQLMKELTSTEESGSVLTKVRERYFRFTDPVFKVYARLRSWKYK